MSDFETRNPRWNSQADIIEGEPSIVEGTLKDFHITTGADGNFLVPSAPVIAVGVSEAKRNDCREKTENRSDPHCAIVRQQGHKYPVRVICVKLEVERAYTQGND